MMIGQHHHKKRNKGQLNDHQPALRANSRPSPSFLNLLLLLFLLNQLFIFFIFTSHIEIPTHILQTFVVLPPHFFVDHVQPQKATEVLLCFIEHLTIIKLATNYNATCDESTCRGGINCCNYDQSLGAYCVTDTYCNSVPPLWETIFIPVFLFAATVGILIVIYYKYKSLKPRLYTLADFVEREVRLQPMERNEHTKLKTITSFE